MSRSNRNYLDRLKVEVMGMNRKLSKSYEQNNNPQARSIKDSRVPTSRLPW